MMELFVRLPTARVITLNVDWDELVFSVKAQIQGKEGIPKKEQRLVFAGRELEDDKTLMAYNIKNETTIDMVEQGNVMSFKTLFSFQHGLNSKWQVMKIKGGAVLKRPVVKMFAMAAKPLDHDMVKACFGMTNINMGAWLKTLPKNTLKLYADYLEHNKHKDRVLLKTVECVKEVAALQDFYFFNVSV